MTIPARGTLKVCSKGAQIQLSNEHKQINSYIFEEIISMPESIPPPTINLPSRDTDPNAAKGLGKFFCSSQEFGFSKVRASTISDSS